ncbi:hypothetical protein [Methylorubrum sp. SB2]|uniref:hypothetical protein n=1 Tax=Methylorubrum subtropicum TaxID=3138812 RepID=UPI00313AB0D4
MFGLPTSDPFAPSPDDGLLADLGIAAASGLLRDGLTMEEITKRSGMDPAVHTTLVAMFVQRLLVAVTPALAAVKGLTPKAEAELDRSVMSAAAAPPLGAA